MRINNLPQTARRKVFWCVDALRGGKIGRHLEDIRRLIEEADAPWAVRRKQELLAALLQHARETTSYYSDKNPSAPLSDYPVVNKTLIRESAARFCSRQYGASKRIAVFTSGSTGTPFEVFHSSGKKLRNSADTIYFARRAGFDIGHRALYMKIWAKEKMSSPFHYFLQNVVPVDVIQLHAAQLEHILRILSKDSSQCGIVGYASALELLAKHLDGRRKGDAPKNVRSIIAISESLSDYTKAALRDYFGVTVVSRYSNQENGILAQQEINGSPQFLVNTASYVLETLKLDSDHPAREGELGRIVVTDLLNYAMPMIRYDTGDVGALVTDSAQPGKLFLSSVEGRKLDLLYDTKGDLVSSFIVYKNMWKYPEIVQYQLIQEGEKQYRFKINANGPLHRDAELINDFKLYLGPDAEIAIEYVSEVPLLASGKRKKIVNLYKKP